MLSLDSAGAAMVAGQALDLSRCYLDKLEAQEIAALREFCDRVPRIAARARAESPAAAALERLEIYGVNVEVGGDARDVVLLKFLRAAEGELDVAEERLAATLKYRADNGISGLASAELPEHFQGHDIVGGTDICGRPVMLSRYGKMDNQKVFGDPDAFVRYRMQIMEKALALLSFRAGDAEDLCQIHDYTGVNLIFKTGEVKAALAALADVFQTHYPETKGTTIFVNFPPLFSKLFQAFASFIPKKTRDKFTILGASDQHLLFEKIDPDHVPEELGGMSREGQRSRALAAVPCRQVSVRAGRDEEAALLEAPAGGRVAWELRACSGEVGYRLEFVPASGAPPEVVSCSGPKQPLQSSAGVVSGEYVVPEAGSLRCVFSNDAAWFQSRLCLCRAASVA